MTPSYRWGASDLVREDLKRQWANSREAKAAQSASSVQAVADMIPLGQPILLGHHSQRRAERDRDRIERGMRRTIEHAGKAREFARRAENIDAAAEHAIYSDDPDAIVKFRARIAEHENDRDTIKAYNAACRKGTADPATLSDRLRSDLQTAINAWGESQCPNGRFPAYTLSNLSTNIRRDDSALRASLGDDPK
jgi:Domain of unknown function (DUF3560)